MTKIGLEIHVQLRTKSKLFCGCKNEYSDIPNTLVCPTCLGLPGSKPRLNRAAFLQAVKVALALNCKINKNSFFSRKSYFYPDLPKNYQISQYEIPLALNGKLGSIKIKRIHLEEDPGKLMHEGNLTFIDYNRSGTPLVEIVTEPDFSTPKEVRLFLNKIILILEYLGIYSRKDESTVRCDANISTTGEKVEIKNINSIRDVEKALEYEIKRQKKEKAKRETRAWDDMKQITILLRAKETEEDYGYIFDPDLAEVELKQKDIEDIKRNIPELHDKKSRRLIRQYKIRKDDSIVLTQDPLLADLFEKVAKKVSPPIAAQWLRRDLMKYLNYDRKTLQDVKIDEKELSSLLKLVEKKKITDNVAKDILLKLTKKKLSVNEYIKKEKLSTAGTSVVKKACEEAIKENKKAVEDYIKGEEKAIHFIMGKVMQKTKGAASPEEVRKILLKLIS